MNHSSHTDRSGTTPRLGTAVLLLAACLAGLGGSPALAQGSAGDLSWHTVDGGGGMWSTGDGFELGGTVGQPDAGTVRQGGSSLHGGFWTDALLELEEVFLTLATDPPGLEVLLDEMAHTAPYAFTTAKGVVHTIGVNSPQPGAPGVKYVYSAWSDGGDQTHDITASANAMLTASFGTWFQLNVVQDPEEGGEVVRTPLGEGDPWYLAGTEVQLQANPAGQYTFVGWECQVPAGSGGDNPLTLTMDGPRQVIAVFLLPGSPDPPGALSVDLNVMVAGKLNPNGPAPKSLSLSGIELNGHAADTLVAIRICGDPTAGWLRFVNSGFPHNRDDVYADGAAAEWHTVAEWTGKRLRGLTPERAYTFYARAKTGADLESALAEVGTFSTNRDCDVNRSGLATALDYAYIKQAILTGFIIGVDQPWPCDVTDDARVNILDLSATRFRILNP